MGWKDFLPKLWAAVKGIPTKYYNWKKEMNSYKTF